MVETQAAGLLRQQGGGAYSFSILERIVVGETFAGCVPAVDGDYLSVSSNGSWWLKRVRIHCRQSDSRLSVSSNGSWWLKLEAQACGVPVVTPFSILERIVVVETLLLAVAAPVLAAFSILERIVVVETLSAAQTRAELERPFSILERIVVVETRYP